MPFFTWLLIGLVAAVALAYLTPKPDTEKLKASTLDDFNFPITQEGTPITLFWGRVRLTGPNVLWYGDLKTVEVTEEVTTGIFSSERVTVGYRYFLGLHLGLGAPSTTNAGVRLLKIWSEEDELWSGDVTLSDSGSLVSINDPEFYGGRKEGGGFVGDLRFYPGTFTQDQNAYLSSTLVPSDLVSNYRGLTHVVFEQVEIGETPNLRPYSFEAENIPNNLGLGGIGSDGDANPAEILVDLMIRDWGGLNIDIVDIDTASFAAAGAVLATEGLGMSFASASATDARNLVQEILRQIDGVIYEEPSTRKLVLKLIRNDYSVGDIPELNESNVIAVSSFSRGLWAQTSNQARIIFQNRSEKYEDKTAFVQDLSNIEAQGGIRSVEFNYPGIKSADLANQIATRELNSISVPIIKVRVAMNRQAATYRPGDVVKLTWPEFDITDLVLRVQKFDLGSYDDGEIAVDLVQDIFAISHVIHSSPPDSDFTDPANQITVPNTESVITVPRWYNVQDVNAGIIGDPDMIRVMYLASTDNEASNSLNAMISEDGGTSYALDLNVPFTPAGELDTQYDYDTLEVDSAVGMSVSNVPSSLTLGNVTDSEIAQGGANLIYVNGEFMAFRNVTGPSSGVYTLNNVWRGLLGTSPKTHPSGSTVYFVKPVDTQIASRTLLADSDVRDFKLLPRNGVNILPLASASNINLTIDNRPELPYLPDNVAFSGTRHPSSHSGTVLNIAWDRRDRLATNITQPGSGDVTPSDNSIDTNPTEYIARWRVGGGSYTETNLGSGTSFNLDVLSTGLLEFELYAQRNSDTNLRTNDFVYRSFNIT